jgi:hypothetical protein
VVVVLTEAAASGEVAAVAAEIVVLAAAGQQHVSSSGGSRYCRSSVRRGRNAFDFVSFICSRRERTKNTSSVENAQQKDGEEVVVMLGRVLRRLGITVTQSAAACNSCCACGTGEGKLGTYYWT